MPLNTFYLQSVAEQRGVGEGVVAAPGNFACNCISTTSIPIGVTIYIGPRVAIPPTLPLFMVIWHQNFTNKLMHTHIGYTCLYVEFSN